MENEKRGNEIKKKNFFEKIMDKLDKKLKEKSKSTGCCNSSNKDNKKTCC